MQLLELVHSTSLATDFHSAVTVFLEGAGRLVPCDGISIMWLEGDHLEVAVSDGPTAPLPGLSLPANQVGATRAVWDSNQAIVVQDTTKDARWHAVPGEEQVSSWLGVPLCVEDRIVGLVEWTDRKPGRFSQDDAALGTELAQHLAPILHRIRLLDDTRQRLRELVEPHLANSPQPRDVGAELREVVREALESTGARCAFVFLLAEGRDHLRCAAAAGDLQDRLTRMTLRGDGSLAGWGIPAACASDRLSPGPSDQEIMVSLGIRKALLLPLRVSGDQAGMLGVAGPDRGRAFGPDVIRLMTHLASQASLIVERFYRSRLDSPRYDYEMVFHSSPLGVGVLTVTGEIRICNPALAVLLSRPDRSLVGRNLSEFLLSSDANLLRHALEEVSITGQRRDLDMRVHSIQGDLRYMRMSLAFAHISNAGGGNLVALVEDVSRVRILEEERAVRLQELRDKHAQLQELDRLKSRFVSNVSHELRTPLAVIKLYATLARKGRPEKQTYYLQTIEQETRRLETMVENVLDLTRLDRRTLSVHPESLSTVDVVSQVLEVYGESANKRGIDLVNRVQGEVPPLWADKNHFIQMLTNLLDNALKYTPRGGQVWVEARVTGSDSDRMLEIAVGDQGVGIPEDERDKVFERFYRGSNNTAGSTGTGLGLSIVRDLMEQHGGEVTLTSQVGVGSVFFLHFPLNRPDSHD